MNIIDGWLAGWKRYADFRGRSRRTEYWGFILGKWVVLAALLYAQKYLPAPVGNPETEQEFSITTVAIALFVMAVIVPNLAVTVRRFHDADMSGWFVLLTAIPVLGFIFNLIICCTNSYFGPNKWGPNPKEETPVMAGTIN